MDAQGEEATGYQNLETQPLIPKDQEKEGQEAPRAYPSLVEQPNSERQSGGRIQWRLIVSPKGLLRLLQIALAVVALVILRVKGDSLWIVMSDINEVYLTIGVLISYLILTPSLLSSHITSGGSATSAPLEILLSLVGAILYFVSGVLIINTWRDQGSANQDVVLTDIPSMVTAISSISMANAANEIYQAMIAVGCLNLINGLVYATELVYTYRHFKKTSQYNNPS